MGAGRPGAYSGERWWWLGAAGQAVRVSQTLDVFEEFELGMRGGRGREQHPSFHLSAWELTFAMNGEACVQEGFWSRGAEFRTAHINVEMSEGRCRRRQLAT